LPYNLDQDIGTNPNPDQQTKPNSNQYNLIWGGS
jgi:hypothetical protein